MTAWCRRLAAECITMDIRQTQTLIPNALDKNACMRKPCEAEPAVPLHNCIVSGTTHTNSLSIDGSQKRKAMFLL